MVFFQSLKETDPFFNKHKRYCDPLSSVLQCRVVPPSPPVPFPIPPAMATIPALVLPIPRTLAIAHPGSARLGLPAAAPRLRLVAARSTVGGDRLEMDANPEGIISGEWPENFSLLSYDDLRSYLKPQILKEKMVLKEVMSTYIRSARPDQSLEEINHYFEAVSGLPVIDDELRCIGVISRSDKEKASLGLKSKVSEVMSAPPITLTPDKTVIDAAALMLKMKIHRIPILNEERHVIGMVTRTDIFTALEVAEV